MELKENNKRNSKTLRSGWRSSRNPHINCFEQIEINCQSDEMKQFVTKYVPEHKEILSFNPNVPYSLKKRGRWKILKSVDEAWRSSGELLAEEEFDIEIGELTVSNHDHLIDTQTFGSFAQRGHRTMYRNHGELVKKSNLSQTWYAARFLHGVSTIIISCPYMPFEGQNDLCII